MLKRDKQANQYLSSDGKYLPGVTTILGTLNKPSVVGWANKVGRAGKTIEEGKQYAVDVGNLAHYFIECHIKGDKPELGPGFGKRAIKRATAMFDSFRGYAESRGATFHASEVQLVDTGDQYGGTLDIIADVSFPSKSRELWDLKTSSSIWPEQIIQVCAYQILWHQNNREIITPRIILIPKSGALQTPDIPEDRIFSAKKVWYYIVPLYYARRDLNEICKHED